MSKTADSTRRVIISCAVTGSIHTPTMSPHLPVTPEQITEQAVEAARAGAAILHLHARDPKDGRPTPNPDVFTRADRGHISSFIILIDRCSAAFYPARHGASPSH